MSYPQPNSNAPVLNGQGFFRLTTQLVSQGDIYESQQGAVAFAIGPNSDISQVGISYFDDTVPSTYMAQAQITPERLFSGAVYARNEPNALYQPAARQGRILIYPTDIWDPIYQPSAFAAGDAVLRFAPYLDVIQYFSSPPSLAPQRSDKSYKTQSLQSNSGGNTEWHVYPFYGRSWASVNFTNRWPDAITFGILGVNLVVESNSQAMQAQETTLLTAAPVAQNASASKVIKSSTDGAFDLLVFSFGVTSVGPPQIAFRLNMSDTVR